MGGCYPSSIPDDAARVAAIQKTFLEGPWDEVGDIERSQPEDAVLEALYFMTRHHANLSKVNPLQDEKIDEALRCALHNMLCKHSSSDDVMHPLDPPPASASGLLYVSHRVNSPRDMSVWASRCLREALNHTAAMDPDGVNISELVPVPKNHRRDQDPSNFIQTAVS